MEDNFLSVLATISEQSCDAYQRVFRLARQRDARKTCLGIKVVFARFVNHSKQPIILDIGIWNHTIDLSDFERSRVIVVPNAQNEP
jgi:hypothetical protein